MSRKPTRKTRSDAGHPAPPPPHLTPHHIAQPEAAPPPKGFVCPKCGAPLNGKPPAAAGASFVWLTRYRPGAIYRVRRCLACGHRIRTVEKMESRSA